MSEVVGEVEAERKVLVIKRVHVTYRLRLGEQQRETAERAHAMHAGYCPVARTIGDCVEISTALELTGSQQ